MVLLQLSVVQPTFLCFYHVDKVGQRFLLSHWNCFQMSRQKLSQLGFVEARPRGDFEMFLVSPQCVHLKLKEIDVIPGRGLTGDRLTRLLTLPPLPLGPDCLDERLVMLTDVDVVRPGVQLQLQFLLGHGPLDLLTVGGIAGRPMASLPLLHQTAELAGVNKSKW